MKSENTRKEKKAPKLTIDDIENDRGKKENYFQFKVVNRRKENHQFVHGE